MADPIEPASSTAALDDAAARLSRFFLMQTILNAGFGVVIGVGLWLIGVPNAVLWGILAGLMRFVPFVGLIIAAFFPIALAAAVDPGWTMVLAAAALFIVAEPLAGHVVEPVLYGQHTGAPPSCPPGASSRYNPKAVSAFRFIPPCSPVTAESVPAGRRHPSKVKLTVALRGTTGATARRSLDVLPRAAFKEGADEPRCLTAQAKGADLRLAPRSPCLRGSGVNREHAAASPANP